MRAVLDNLLRNAWKFTERRKIAQISFGCKIEEGIPTFFTRRARAE